MRGSRWERGIEKRERRTVRRERERDGAQSKGLPPIPFLHPLHSNGYIILVVVDHKQILFIIIMTRTRRTEEEKGLRGRNWSERREWKQEDMGTNNRGRP